LGRRVLSVVARLPEEFKGPFLELRFGFYYNLDPEKQR
jgi:hypothetical protein